MQFLHDNFHKEGISGVVQEGSSRSGKTWSDIDFLVWLTSTVETDATINIIKETYNSFKTTLYEDFNRRFPMFGLQSPFAERQEVRSFKLFGNKINLLGADSDTVYHGVGCDYFWINESLDVDKNIFDQSEQRCRKFWWMDYNPKVTEHWVYDRICNREDVGFIRTTFLDNPGISSMEKKKILSYEPTHPDDRDKPVKKRRPHPTNILNGTADDYMWNVYGLGLRSSPEGVVFQHVNWISEDELPDLERWYYGMDFGFTNDPSTLVKGGVQGNNLYLQKLFYEPTDSGDLVAELIDKLRLKSAVIWADSANSGMISYLRRKFYKVFAVEKPPGSINYGISLLKNYKIHIVDCPEWRREQSGYKYRVVNGISLDEPIDGYNHLWDAARYLAMANLVNKK